MTSDIDPKALALRVADALDEGDVDAVREQFDRVRTVSEARALAAFLREAVSGPRYFLSTDNDSHWYLVPVAQAAEWEDWAAIPEDDERAWDAPEFAIPLGGAPCLVTFASPHLNGSPLPPPPARIEDAEEPSHDRR